MRALPHAITGLALLLACSAAAAQSTPAPPAPPAGAAPAESSAPAARPRYRRDQLTEQEIAASTVSTDALDLVRRLRPAWLHNRGSAMQPDPDGSTEVQVWLNGSHAGNVEVLRSISVSRVIEMRWVDPIQARSLYGPGNGRGVIAITGR